MPGYARLCQAPRRDCWISISAILRRRLFRPLPKEEILGQHVQDTRRPRPYSHQLFVRVLFFHVTRSSRTFQSTSTYPDQNPQMPATLAKTTKSTCQTLTLTIVSSRLRCSGAVLTRGLDEPSQGLGMWPPLSSREGGAKTRHRPENASYS
jgi:hypothetical protein